MPRKKSSKKADGKEGKSKSAGKHTSNKSQLSEDVKSYLQHLKSLEESFTLATRPLGFSYLKADRALNDFAKLYCEVKKIKGGQTLRLKDAERLSEFLRLTDIHARARIPLKVVPESFLVTLVSQFDNFLRSTLRNLLLLNKNVLKGSHTTLEVSEMLRYGRIEEAYEFVIDRLLEEVMRGSHADQFDFIKKTFDVDWKRDELWQRFIEITERRNLFVHTGGVVSSQYLEVCRKNGLVAHGAKIGSRLTSSPEYYKSATAILLELGIKVSQILWRKVLPDQISLADSSFDKVVFELLTEKRYAVLKGLLEFATSTLKGKFSDEEYDLTSRINLALVLKAMGEKKKVAECMADVDWSRKRPMFQLAEAIVAERYHQAAKLMLDEDVTFSKSHYREWPLFDGFRNTKEFKAGYLKVFGEQFQQEERVQPKLVKVENLETDPSAGTIQ